MGKEIKWDPGRGKQRNVVARWLSFIRVEHTVFSLPFVYAGALLVNSNLSVFQVIMLFLALFGLRTFGIAINNIVDYPIDKLNPRTQGRHLVSGEISLKEAWTIAAIGVLLFIYASFELNVYALMLSPLALLIIGTYPYAKRWHPLPHIHLGFALGFSIAGGAIAVMDPSEISLIQAILGAPWVYIFAIVFWVAGFDTIYSIMDMEFDREYHLGSIPALVSSKNAKIIAMFFHVIFLALLYFGYFLYGLGFYTFTTNIVTTALISVQHFYAWKNDIKKAFNINLVISITVALGIILDKTLPLLY